jgi:hypothetical protein
MLDCKGRDMKSYSQQIADAIAHAIINNKSRKKFATLHADAIEEIQMAQKDLQHPKTDAQIAAEKLKSYEQVLARLDALETAVAQLQNQKAGQ